jgi:hypothetical protein
VYAFPSLSLSLCSAHHQTDSVNVTAQQYVSTKRVDAIVGNFLEDIIKDRPDNAIAHIIDSINRTYPDLAKAAVENINKGVVIVRYVVGMRRVWCGVVWCRVTVVLTSSLLPPLPPSLSPSLSLSTHTHAQQKQLHAYAIWGGCGRGRARAVG